MKRKIVEIPMSTNGAPLIGDLFLFCCKRDCITSLFDDKEAEIIQAFNSTYKYLDDLFKDWQSLIWGHGMSNLTTWALNEQNLYIWGRFLKDILDLCLSYTLNNDLSKKSKSLLKLFHKVFLA